MITRRAFIKAIALTGIGVLSCSKRKSKQRRYDTDDTSVPKALPPGEHIVRMKVTAYCPCSKCCGMFADYITASGHTIKIDFGQKFVAADKRYPFGTLMFVPGYCNETPYPGMPPHGKNIWIRAIGQVELVKVLDRGGAIKGNHIDVYFDSHQEALNWGVRYLDVTVLSSSVYEDEKEKENKK